MWSRALSTKMGIQQEEFVKAFVLALGNEAVISKLQTSICGQLTQEVAELREVVQARDNQIATPQNEVGKLKTALDEQEQYSRRNNLRITGIPEKENEDVGAVVQEFLNKNVCVAEPITVADIDRVHRLGPRRDGRSTRPIILRLSTFRARNRIYKNRVLLNPRRRHGPPSDPWRLNDTTGNGEAAASLPQTDPGPGAGRQAVYINEDLTSSKAKLLWQARQAKRDNRIKDCWSTNGLKDTDTLQQLGIKSKEERLYLKDLGPQIGWATVLFTEYVGPLTLYLWVYQRPWLFYGDRAGDAVPMSFCAHVAAGCWTFHYVKRILETQFVHRFSHSTMPLFNLFKNCSFYWGFTAFIAYHVNHPLFTPPSITHMYVSLTVFLLCEFGNLSIHLALRNLRPLGSKERKIPYPDGNPMTMMFNFVSCPHYTYEFGSWLAFTSLTQCLPAGLFALAGFYQMSVWALGKHRAYKKEFKNYPQRKAILPFLL